MRMRRSPARTRSASLLGRGGHRAAAREVGVVFFLVERDDFGAARVVAMISENEGIAEDRIASVDIDDGFAGARLGGGALALVAEADGPRGPLSRIWSRAAAAGEAARTAATGPDWAAFIRVSPVRVAHRSAEGARSFGVGGLLSGAAIGGLAFFRRDDFGAGVESDLGAGVGGASAQGAGGLVDRAGDGPAGERHSDDFRGGEASGELPFAIEFAVLEAPDVPVEAGGRPSP